ncbi:helix-turn-helix protein [Dyadobacter jejuensis]|uniref:Helix-turn-helix protein n=2 Tax=Dyadobacter jejuensis TaxID=1082580 RepID=A0A316ACC2_9BACT|nr:helix-turn-helix protein [Dyadobacter jejuensis]
MAEFGTELGVSAQQISKIETDQSKPSFELADKICEKYGVTLDWLMRGIETPKTETSKPTNDSGDFITVSKDEFIELQRMALKRQQEEKKELEKRLAETKNG